MVEPRLVPNPGLFPLPLELPYLHFPQNLALDLQRKGTQEKVVKHSTSDASAEG